MKNWKTKIFGDTRANFYGWIFATLGVLGASVWTVLLALKEGAVRSPVALMLIANYLLLAGILCILLQNYCARVARKLEADEARKQANNKTPPA